MSHCYNFMSSSDVPVVLYTISAQNYWEPTGKILCTMEREPENYGASNNCLEFQNESAYESTSACVVFFIFLNDF